MFGRTLAPGTTFTYTFYHRIQAKMYVTIPIPWILSVLNGEKTCQNFSVLPQQSFSKCPREASTNKFCGLGWKFGNQESCTPEDPNVGVSKNNGTPKWMVYDGLFHGKAYEQMDDLGVPLFLETPMYGMYHGNLRVRTPAMPRLPPRNGRPY